MSISRNLANLASSLEGELKTDSLHLALYATDASVYREIPLAVAFPASTKDIQLLIQFANQNQTSLIPRTAGTSLAGQCVGQGIVVDLSKHLNRILSIDLEKKQVTVQPGVIRDELNAYLKEHNMFFGPETSTANRAMIGGMVGNNSCGTNSIVYGTTRDHVIEINGLLSDGSEVLFRDLNEQELSAKLAQTDLEGSIYSLIHEQLKDESVREEIEQKFPKPSIHRRNTGYALDALMQCASFTNINTPFNLCKLMAGSEGTLSFMTEITLQCSPCPPPESLLVAAHFHTIPSSLEAVVEAMKHQPHACELMDKLIMDCTKENIEYNKYRFFLEGDPAAILLIEFRGNDIKEVQSKCDQLIASFNEKSLGYAFPIIDQKDSKKVWSLRKAGLGLLANIPGDRKAVAVIEDTAVDLEDLPSYIAEFTTMMESFGQKAVYYAHAGAGEIHLRPILNLKEEDDVNLFKEIAFATAELVKKYRGSLSGEHGDGRVRAPFLPYMIGDKNYALLRKIKQVFDPNNIFNPGKIIDAAAIDSDLRYAINRPLPSIETFMNFEDGGGFLPMAEKCNGSGDCRKTALSGGTMCPSYMATKNEKDTTRARANALREFITQADSERERWNSSEIIEALDLCLSCKGCKSECPSNVDMAALKAEYTYQNYKLKGKPWRAKLFGNVANLYKLGSISPSITNWINDLDVTKKILGLAAKRSAPKLAKETLKSWFKKSFKSSPEANKLVYFFADEFTNFLDVEEGKKAIQLLDKLGYTVQLAPISDSGRAFLSKGLLDEARELANQNIAALKPLIKENTPFIGIEPSAILSFGDEYLRLISNKEYTHSTLVKNCFFIDDFIAEEFNAGNISSQQFTTEHQQIILHGHCHQKALSDVNNSVRVLSIPSNYHVELLPTGCCGMAGSFGYEKEHYEVSMQVGELVLFPALRKADESSSICAPGTSCRHQIKDGIGKKAHHTVSILWDALLK